MREFLDQCSGGVVALGAPQPPANCCKPSGLLGRWLRTRRSSSSQTRERLPFLMVALAGSHLVLPWPSETGVELKAESLAFLSDVFRSPDKRLVDTHTFVGRDSTFQRLAPDTRLLGPSHRVRSPNHRWSCSPDSNQRRFYTTHSARNTVLVGNTDSSVHKSIPLRTCHSYKTALRHNHSSRHTFVVPYTAGFDCPLRTGRMGAAYTHTRRTAHTRTSGTLGNHYSIGH
jgi:hypothetical protein